MTKKMIYAVLGLLLLNSCISRTCNTGIEENANSIANLSHQEYLIKQAEKKGFQRGKIQHSLNTKWSKFPDKDFYSYIKTLKSGVKVYRAEITNMMMEVYVLNDIITIQSSTIMLGKDTKQLCKEMDAWLRSCNPISIHSNTSIRSDGETTTTKDYIFQGYTATIVERKNGIQYMLSLSDGNEITSSDLILDKQYTNKHFSIKYPSSWHIIQDEQRATKNTTVSLQIMEKQKNEYDFCPNINIIVSNKRWSQSTSWLVEQTSINNQHLIPSYRTLSINNNVYLSNYKGSVLRYTFSMQEYNLNGDQYIIKKPDNTTFIITATTDSNKYQEQIKLIQSILYSLIIK